MEKEKKYIEKIKQLKTENKKLVQLLKDSEKLFNSKIQESKQQIIKRKLSLIIRKDTSNHSQE
jgi:CHASE3 domain sensor protein